MTYHYDYSMGVRDMQLILLGLKLIVDTYEGVAGKEKDVMDAKSEIRYMSPLCLFDEDGNVIGFKREA